MARLRSRLARWLVAGVFLGILGAVALTITVPTLRWRAAVVGLKMRARLPDLGWGELLTLLLPDSPVYLEPLIRNPNPYAAIQNPYQSAEDVKAGEERFRADCSSCHGTGGRGPDLASQSLRRGASDWALYRTLANGIPGTGMAASDLNGREIWQLVGFVRQIRQGVRERVEQAAPPTTIHSIASADLDQTPNADWVTYSGQYSAHRHSALAQIDRTNVQDLRAAWLLPLPGVGDDPVETSPLVVDGVMFLTVPPQRVLAIDLRTRRSLWVWERALPSRLSLCCGRVNRGLAILERTLYVGTLDAHLVALDAVTGKERWDVEVADSREGYSITGAPLVVGDLVVTGIAGGEFGIRGFLDAYDATTGQRRWRFHTIPAPGQPGSETWSGDAWRTGGGPTWLTGAYDPPSDLLYWGVGNPGPNYAGDTRPGDNLYSNSVVALEATTGTLRWHFQFTPHDEYDWDAVQIPMLADVTVDGAARSGLVWANRNAFYYVLDRRTGEFLGARPFARQTWADSLDARGRPWVRPDAHPRETGTQVYPSVTGATNWWSPSYSPATGLVYVPTFEQGGIFFARGAQYRAGKVFTGSASQSLLDEPYYAAVRALEAATGELVWESRLPVPTPPGGLLGTDGGVVFGSVGTLFFALDDRDGRELWRFDTGARIAAAPTTFLVDGRQLVAIPAGATLIAFGLGWP